MGLDRANLTRYLAVLGDLGLLEKEIPVLERHPEKSRKGLYRISDPFTAKWFVLVHPFRNQLETGDLDPAWPEIRARNTRRLPMAVEPVVRDLFRQSCADRIPFQVAFYGRQWSDRGEFDVVYLDADRQRAFVLEVKWTRDPVGVSLLEDLRRRVARDPDLSSLECTCAVLSRAGFQGTAPRRDAAFLLDATDLLPRSR